MPQNPKVFISYSHDSDTHKAWVLDLAIKLLQNSIDAILDLWDLHLGDDVTRFMEEGILVSNKVLLICTESYCLKANNMKGGVGFEKLIVTGQMVKDLGTNKFIPIIKQQKDNKNLPTFLNTRLYIDFSKPNEFASSFDLLLRELLDVPMHIKPALGLNPFNKVFSTIINQIIPFEHINGIKAGFTKYSDVLKQFGKPTNSHYTKDKVKLINYAEYGMTLIIDEKNNATDPTIDSLYVEYPFDGRTPNGLYLGMAERNALEICENNYFKKFDGGESKSYSQNKDSYDSFQIWIDGGKLIRMKLFPNKNNSALVGAPH